MELLQLQVNIEIKNGFIVLHLYSQNFLKIKDSIELI